MAADPKCFVARAIVVARHKGVYEDKERLCVVLRVEPDRLEVAYGQGSRGTDRDLEVKPGDARSKRYKPTNPTFFRPGNICSIPRADVIKYVGTCSNDDLLTLQEFARDRHLADAPPVLELKKDGATKGEQVQHHQVVVDPEHKPPS